MMTVANPGDKVIVFRLFMKYGADTILSGAEPIYVPLHPPLFNLMWTSWKPRSASTPRR